MVSVEGGKKRKREKKEKKRKKKEHKIKKEKKRKRADHADNTKEDRPQDDRDHPNNRKGSKQQEEYNPAHPRPLVESSALSSDTSVHAKGDDDSSISLLLFYQYIEPPWSDAVYKESLRRAEAIATESGVNGRMRVAKEGFNCTLTTEGPIKMRQFCAALRAWMPEVFCRTEFKITNDLPYSKRFSNIKVMPVSELVNYGLDGEKAPPIQRYSGTHLEPEEYHKKLAESNTVVIDVRNHYESIIGHFDAPNSEFIDPNMRKSTEFPVWLDQASTKEQLRGKQVLMYCTGGIRCERASALLKYKMANDPTVQDLGIKDVFQLQGGVDKYFKQFPDGGYWKGKNYTFDKRYAHTPTAKVEDATEPLSNCAGCDKPWDRFGGKRRCPTCGVPSLLCNECYKNKTLDQSVRCDLCVQQGIHSKASLRRKEEEDFQRYERRQRELGLLNPSAALTSTDKDPVSANLITSPECVPNPDGITRLFLKNMCRNGMTEQILIDHLPGVTHIVWRLRQGEFFGHGWVEMESPDLAAAAVTRSGEKVLGRPLYIMFEAPDPKDLWPPPRSAVCDL